MKVGLINLMKIIKIDGTNPEPDKIEIVRRAMKEGSIVVYPTDTVYGIGANIFDDKAILKVFSIKKGQEKNLYQFVYQELRI